MGAARGCVPTQSVRPLFLSTTFTVPDYVIIYTILLVSIGGSLAPRYLHRGRLMQIPQQYCLT